MPRKKKCTKYFLSSSGPHISSQTIIQKLVNHSFCLVNLGKWWLLKIFRMVPNKFGWLILGGCRTMSNSRTINYFTTFLLQLWRDRLEWLTITYRPTIFSITITPCHVTVVARNCEIFCDSRLFRTITCWLSSPPNEHTILQNVKRLANSYISSINKFPSSKIDEYISKYPAINK